LHEQIEKCAKSAAQKILAKWKTGKPPVSSLGELIAAEFGDLNP
jgi:hypothetical protein